MTVRYVTGLLALILLTAVVVATASPPGLVGAEIEDEWPPMRITYETTIHPRTGSTLQNRRVTELTYLSRDDWHDEVVEATFTAGSSGATRELRDGIFTQNIPEAGRPIIEDIPEGYAVAPERWLGVDFMTSLEDMGFRREALNPGLIQFTYESTMPCDQLSPDVQPEGCETGEAITDREIVIARTDLSDVPFPIEHRYELDGVVLEVSTVREIVLLDPVDPGGSS